MNSQRFPRLARLASGFALAGVLALPTCGKAESEESSKPSVGPTIWTIPVLENGKEEITIDGRTVRVGTARGWETESVRVELMGTQSLLAYRFAEFGQADWRTYTSFMKDKEFVVRIADLDLMILAGGPQQKAEGLWLIGPRESAEERAQELLRRLAVASEQASSQDSAASD
jgi:hypothetical protein